MKKILVVTNLKDSTVDYIIGKYKQLAEFYRYNVDDFQNYTIIINENGWRLSNSFWSISDKDIYSIYYRKPRVPDLTDYENMYHVIIHKDIISIINGIVDSFHGPVLTAPNILRKTENKIFQLLTAKRLGMRIPMSFLGNSNDNVMQYLNQKSIIKPISLGKINYENTVEIYQTSLFDKCKEDISLTPIYLQEYIEKQYEVRLTIINNYVYPVKIVTTNKIDWRKDYQNHKYTIIECPEDITESCLNMMKEYDLKFGAFDFIVTPNNEWFFLEVNPNGQWLWLEKALNLDISNSIINYLLK